MQCSLKASTNISPIVSARPGLDFLRLVLLGFNQGSFMLCKARKIGLEEYESIHRMEKAATFVAPKSLDVIQEVNGGQGTKWSFSVF